MQNKHNQVDSACAPSKFENKQQLPATSEPIFLVSRKHTTKFNQSRNFWEEKKSNAPVHVHILIESQSPNFIIQNNIYVPQIDHAKQPTFRDCIVKNQPNIRI